jgi:hypothetical protein
MIVAAVAIGILSIVGIVRAFAESFDGPRIAVPSTTTVHLDTGRWIIYEHLGSTQSEDPTFDGPTTIGVTDVDVTDPSGMQLAIDDVSGTQTLTSNSEFFVGVVEFHAPRTDDYTITVRGERGDVLVARPLTDRFGRAALWFLVGFAAFVLLVVGIVFTALPPPRPRPSPAWLGPYSPAGPPAGWYADPSGGVDLRWWDGARWTDQVRAR